MIPLLKLFSLSTSGRYVATITKTSNESTLKPQDDKKSAMALALQCTNSSSCNNRVICRCSICSELLCYEHATLHGHQMIHFEILK